MGILITDDVDEAFEYLTREIEKFEEDASSLANHKTEPGSPFLSPMCDPKSGAYLKDTMGRVRKLSHDTSNRSPNAVPSKADSHQPRAPEFTLAIEEDAPKEAFKKKDGKRKLNIV